VSVVALLIGSLSDRPLVKESGMMEVFEAVGVQVDVHVISAHRNVEALHRFCTDAEDIQVFIAAAALATALPGAIAGATQMRKVVIGVPLDDYGVDSCIRMPPGVPVLTAGVGKAGLRNAAIATCQILAISDPDLAARLNHYLGEQTRPPVFNVSLDSA
jgi:phosphoribosylaminoimidazole carboxylase PurE protein